MTAISIAFLSAVERLHAETDEHEGGVAVGRRRLVWVCACVVRARARVSVGRAAVGM